MIVHSIRLDSVDGDDTHYAVDLEWAGGRAWYRFTYQQAEPVDAAFSPRHGGLPLAFYQGNQWAHVQLCALVGRVHGGDVPAFPVELTKEAA